jgi:hypothetical protein
MEMILKLISENVTILTLFATWTLAVITMLYTFINRKMLQLSSQPTVKIEAKDITISPDIKNDTNLSDIENIVDNKERFWVSFNLEILNIGNNPAQNICIDANVNFKKRKPLDYKELPIHLPTFIDFLPPQSGNDIFSEKKVNISFDNFVARELIKDFFEGRKDWPGSPLLVNDNEMKDLDLWPSPKITVRCLYSDIQGQNYCSEIQLFFHIYKDSDEKKLKIYLLNMGELNFIGIKRVSKRYREKYLKNTRSLRYTAFFGEKHHKNELILLKAIRNKDISNHNK